MGMDRIIKIDLGRIYNRSTMQEGIRTARRAMREGRTDGARMVLRALQVDLGTAITVLEACAAVENQGKLLEEDIYIAHAQFNEVRSLYNEVNDIRRMKNAADH